MYKEYNKRLMDVLIAYGKPLSDEKLCEEIGIARNTLVRFKKNKAIRPEKLLQIMQWVYKREKKL